MCSSDLYQVGLLQGMNFKNEESIMREVQPVSITKFFDNLKEQVTAYYEG